MENNMGTAEMKQVTETVENVEFQMEKLQETVENMELMMEELKKTVENVEFQMEALKETVESMEVTTEELKESTESGFKQMNVKLDHLTNALKTLQSQVDPAKLQLSCTIVFGGQSFGMSAPAGAGAVLLAEDGSRYYGFCEGLGCQMKEVAEYRALILGMEQAVMKGFKHVTVKGDSEFVINQFGEPWQTIDSHLRSLCLQAMKLRNNFDSFSIQHIPKEHNRAALAYANRAFYLEDGQVQEELVT